MEVHDWAEQILRIILYQLVLWELSFALWSVNSETHKPSGEYTQKIQS